MPDVPASGPFFERFGADQRFCFFHAGASARPARGCVLAVHAFAEEMNKSRPASADGARALAAAGFAVLQVDLAGCGDSAGVFDEATWAGWIEDLSHAWAWLDARCPGPRWIWGTRLGGLLADHFAAACEPHADGLLLWQPVVNGAQHLGQFLRLKTVNSLLRETTPTTSTGATTQVERVAQASPRADLAAGRSIEVAGYRLTPLLADAIESARLGSRTSGDARHVARVRWLEVTHQAGATLTPVAAKVVDRWRDAGSEVAVEHVLGSAFWQTQEIERCDALVTATVEALSA